MFKKLKDKIAEEVKQSPQRFADAIQDFQAAVSSAPATNSSEVSSDQFFSITEEDTPQNSPAKGGAKPKTTPNNFSPPNNSLNNNGIPQIANRQRRLSNSSMASDISFRLPSYDSPAVFHLQSDIDASASEFEFDTTSATSSQLESITKEQLHAAYKKALDRYQKYRNRYTEIAKRYRDLERDNNKARSVLVETQDKALRRVSELREQCSLEQQAKAHLESALRLEMEENQCVIKTLKTKLSLLGENPELVLEGKEKLDSVIETDTNANLVDLSDFSESTKEHSNGVENRETQAKFEALQKAIELYKCQVSEEQQRCQSLDERIKELNENLRQSNEKVKELQSREEENTILLAENKMMIHSELETKDEEVKSLRVRIQDLEKLQGQFEKDCQIQKNRISSLESQLTEHESIKHEKESKLSDLESSKVKLKEEHNKLELELKETINQKEQLQLEFDEQSKVIDNLNINLDQLRLELESTSGVNTELVELQQGFQLKQQEIENQVLKIKDLEQENIKLRDDCCKLEKQIQDLVSKNKSLEGESEKLKNDCTKFEKEMQERESRCQSLEEEKNQIKEDCLKFENDFNSSTLQNQNYIKTIAELTADKTGNQEKCKKLEDELQNMGVVKSDLTNKMTKLEAEAEELRQKISSTTAENTKLAEEIKMIKVINENSESEAIKSIQESMKMSLKEVEAKLRTTDTELKATSKEKDLLTEKFKELQRSLGTSQAESSTKLEELTVLKSKVETLRNEKRDLEKTLEKEIRDKNELKSQVTNILQEIGRLEEQLKLVRESHTLLEDEKRQLEEKIDNLQNFELKLRDEKEQLLLSKIKEFEGRLQEVQCENSQLAEKICLLVEQNTRLQNTLKDAESSTNRDKNAISEEMQSLKKEHLALQESADNQIKELDRKLKECLDENTHLLNVKEGLEQDLRSIQDENEVKDKEKLCVLDTNRSLQADLDETHAQVNSIRDQVTRLENEIETLKLANEALNNEKHSLAKEKESAVMQSNKVKDLKEGLKKELDVSRQKIADLELNSKRNSEVTEKNVSEMEKKLKTFEDVKVENEYLNTLVKQLELDLQKLKEESFTQFSQLKDVKEKYNFTENEMSNLQEQKSKFDCLMADKNAELDDTNVELSKMRSEVANLKIAHKTQVDNLAEENKELRSEISAKQIIITDLNQDLSRHEKQLSQSVSNNEKDKDELQAKTKELESETNKFRELQMKYTELTIANDELRNKIKELETSLNDTVIKQSQLTLDHSNKSSELGELSEENETLKLKLNNLEKTLNSKLVVLEEKHNELITENRSLKEQTNNGKPDQDFDKLLSEKSDMEQRLQKILNEVQEVSNRNMFLEQQCENNMILEQSNERLKLANDKLSRQLDETLVTMHHHEGIQANTEFEYLKNIMFQYLSGNINGNNNTLVKVIAAVLKFSPQQTQVVLEKENQRHSLVGQINNLL